MPKFAANLSLLFAELDYLDRFSAAAQAGFKAVEILFPYEFDASLTRQALDTAGLELVLINAPPREGGAPGYAAISGGESRFETEMQQVARYAQLLRPDLVHVMAGYEKSAASRSVFIRNLQWVADHAPHQEFTIEPLNSSDQPGYFLDDYDLAADILSAVDRPNVGLQYDSYHAQIIHGDAHAVWERFCSLITHVQIGASPDRSEPGRGATNFVDLFRAIDESGYDGWVSAEYHPSTSRTCDSLEWMRQ